MSLCPSWACISVGVRFFLTMRGEAPPEHLKRGMKCNSESVRDRVQAQAQPIVRMNGVASGLRARACIPEHEGFGPGSGTSPATINRLAHGSGNRDKR